MFTVNCLVCIIGLLIWALFTKWQKVADSWLSEVGKLMFFAALLAWLFVIGSKVAV